MPIRYVSGDLFDNTHDARAFAHGCNCQRITRCSSFVRLRKYYPGNKEGHIPTRSASEGPMKSSESRRMSPWDD